MLLNRTNLRTRVALFGAAPDTSNMGVSALFASTVAGVHRLAPGVSFAVFDNGLGVRRSRVFVGSGDALEVDRYGARAGMRFDRPENLANMSICSRLGAIGGIANRCIRELDRCTSALDVSGGDSFSDIYGRKRFFCVARPKLIALRRGIPLILLPQTYGPYKDATMRRIASEIVRRAEICWARDERSYETLIEMLGASYNPERHRQGVDLAFGLEPHNSRELLPAKLLKMLDSDRSKTPLVGFNISGLIHNHPDVSSTQYCFRADYRLAVRGFLNSILDDSAANVVLVPHVMTPRGHYESDSQACEQVKETLKSCFTERVVVAPNSLDQHQVKWLIGQTDWFAGTRMHSTIAGLSSGVPTATITYSDKALGVFESCGQQDHVVDPRALDTEQVVAKLRFSFESRDAARESLRLHCPLVKRRAHEQMAAIVSRIIELSPTSVRPETLDPGIQS